LTFPQSFEKPFISSLISLSALSALSTVWEERWVYLAVVRMLL